jgi:hypothetical protein
MEFMAPAAKLLSAWGTSRGHPRVPPPPPPASCAPFLLLHLPPVSSGDRFGWGAPLAAAV